jgi:imidazole glycerol-phosphate synthase subunit HisH
MITIINYGLGNIRSFVNVYNRLNIPTNIATSPAEIKDAKKIILPGVGAFDQAMELLENSGMRPLLDELVLGKKIPVLGICVGMQIIGNSSEEGSRAGLGWISGEVKRIDTSLLNQKTKLPHMGWNEISPIRKPDLFRNIPNKSRFYFLHSYCFHCSNENNSIATAEYGETIICAIASENIYGVQFHPEKSHQNGIQLLKNFGAI